DRLVRRRRVGARREDHLRTLVCGRELAGITRLERPDRTEVVVDVEVGDLVLEQSRLVDIVERQRREAAAGDDEHLLVGDTRVGRALEHERLLGTILVAANRELHRDGRIVEARLSLAALGRRRLRRRRFRDRLGGRSQAEDESSRRDRRERNGSCAAPDHPPTSHMSARTSPERACRPRSCSTPNVHNPPPSTACSAGAGRHESATPWLLWTSLPETLPPCLKGYDIPPRKSMPDRTERPK